MILVRSLAFAFAFYLWSLVAAIVMLPVLIGPRRYAQGSLKVWGAVVTWLLQIICGVRVEVRGREHMPTGPALIAPKSAAILRKLHALLPGLEVEIDYAWAGAFGQSTTSMPLIGAVPGLPNTYAVMGFGGNGITYSVIASQVVGAAIRGETDLDADLYSLG